MAKIGDVEGILRLRDEFTATLVKASTQLKQAGQTALQLGASMQQAGSAMTRSITLPLAALGGVAIKSFSDFDSAMTKSTAIMGDLSDVMRKDMVEAAKEVALTTSFSAKAAAESFFFLASAGLNAEASIAALPAVAQFAQAGMFDMATATDLLTDAQSALGLVIRDDAVKNMENMIRVSDVLAKANQLANASIQQFSEALTSEAGAALKTFKIDVEEGVAVLAAFADQGIKGQVAGTSLSRILRLMTSSAVKNKEAFEELNVEVFDSAGNINNMADIIEDMEEALGGLSDETRIAALEQLGFKARVQGVILPLLGTSAAIRDYEKAHRAAAGTTKEIAEKQLESFREKMGLLKDRVVDTAITLGADLAGAIESLIPLFNKAIDALGFAVDLFTKLPGPIKGAVIAFFALLAAAGPVLLVVGSLVFAFGQLSISMSAIPIAKVAASLNTTLLPALSRMLVFGKQGALTGLAQSIKIIGPAALSAASGLLAMAVAAAKAALAFAFSPLGIALAVIAAGVALTTFVLKDGGIFENWMAGTKESVKELREGVTNLDDSVGKLGLAIADKFVGSIPEITAVISAGVAAGRDMNDIISELTSTFEVGTKTGDALRAGMIEISAEINSAAREAAAMKAELERQLAVTEAYADKQDAIAKALMSVGIATEESALEAIAQLALAMESGQLPTKGLTDKILSLQEEFRDLAAESPKVQTALDGIATSADEETIAILKLDEAMSTFSIQTVDQALLKIGQLNLLIEAGAASPAVLAAAVKALEEEFETLAGTQPNVQTALDSTRAKMDEEAIAVLELQEAIKGLNLVELGDLEEELDLLSAAFEAGAGSPKQLEDALVSLAKKADDAELGSPGLAQEIEVLAKQLAVAAIMAGRVQDPFEKFADIISDLGVKTIPATLAKLKDIPAAIRAGVIPADQLGTKVDELDAELKELAKDSPEVAAALRLIEDAARDMGAELDKDTGIFGRFKNKLGEGIGGLTDPNNIAGLIGTASDSFLKGDFLAGTEEIVSQIGATIGAAFGPIGKMVGQLAGKLVPLIAGIFSKPEFKKIMADAGRDLGVELSDELAKTIAERSKELGSRFGAITEALPEIIAEAGVKSAESLSTFVSRARDNLSLLDGGVFTSAEAFGNLGESLALLIPEMDNFGAGASITAQVFETLNAALGQVRTGLADTKDAAKLLGETFPLLTERLDDMGAAGVIGIRGIIDETRALGIEVESVTKFVQEQTKKIAGGVGLILSSLKTRISQLPEDLNFAQAFKQAQAAAKAGGVTLGVAIAEGVEGSVLSPKLKAAILGIGTQAKFAAGAIATVFAEALASGIPVTQIIEETRGQIEQLGAMFVELGVAAPESFNKIAAFAAKLGQEDVAPVIEGIQGIGQAMEGLRDLGLATQEDFSDFGTSLTSAFEQLSLSGLSSQEIFAAIGPQLQELADLQTDFGFEVDAATEALLDQARASGVVKGVQLDTADAVTAGFQGLFDRFDAFLEKQGVATEGMFNFGEQATTAMDKVSEAVNTTATDMATGFQAASQTAIQAAQKAADAIVVTEAEKNAAVQTLLRDLTSLNLKALTDVEQAQLDSAKATVKAWEESTGKQVEILQQAMEPMGGAISEIASLFTGTLGDSAVTTFLTIEQASSSTAITFADQWSEATGLSEDQMVEFAQLTDEKLRDMGTSAEETAQALAGSFFDGTEESKLAMENLKLATQQAFEEMQIESEISTTAIADQFDNIASAGSDSFSSIGEAAGRAARDAIDAFGEMEDELVGASIFPDTAKLASADLRSIGVVAESVAAQAEGAFQAADLSLTPGTTPGVAIRSDTLSAPLLKAGGSPALANLEGRGGKGEPIQITLVVDGQVLAKTTIKNMPRALANAGVANRQR